MRKCQEFVFRTLLYTYIFITIIILIITTVLPIKQYCRIQTTVKKITKISKKVLHKII